MAQTVFFSWQSDTPTRTGRNFIKAVLDDVCKEIAANTTVDEALRGLTVDSDTKNMAGQPPIVDTIFKKIDAAGVFVGDMTFVGKRIDERPTPNPNVLIEYGWALKSKTHERVILLMNAAYGEPSDKSLPFNLKHMLWPITYTLADDATMEQKKKEKTKLIKVLAAAVRASLQTLPTAVAETPPQFPAAETRDGPARFRAKGEALGIDDDFGSLRGDVLLAEGSAIWLRLMPIADSGKRWPSHLLKESAIKDGHMHLSPFSRGGGSDFLRAEDGFGIYTPVPRQDKQEGPITTSSIAFAFETGEVWSLDTNLLSRREDWLPPENYFTTALTRYSRFLQELGIEGPYRWMVGMEGVKGRQLNVPPPPGHINFGDAPTCVADLIQEQGTYDGSGNPTSALKPFFEKVFSKCGRARPDHLPQ